MERKYNVEIKNGIAYYCNYKKYTGEDWDGDVLNLLAKNATFSHLFAKMEMRQGCRDENGFYPNYLYLLVDPEDCNFNVEDMLEDYGFGFKKEEVKFGVLYTQWDKEDEITDVIVEEGW